MFLLKRFDRVVWTLSLESGMVGASNWECKGCEGSPFIFLKQDSIPGSAVLRVVASPLGCQGAMHGVTVSMSAYLACHQCYLGFESSGCSMWHFLKLTAKGFLWVLRFPPGSPPSSV